MKVYFLIQKPKPYRWTQRYFHGSITFRSACILNNPYDSRNLVESSPKLKYLYGSTLMECLQKLLKKSQNRF